MVSCVSKEATADQLDVYLALQCIFTTVHCFMCCSFTDILPPKYKILLLCVSNSFVTSWNN